MRRLIPAPVLGSITLVLVISNLLVMAVPLYLFILCKLLSPTKAMRDWAYGRTVDVAEAWIAVNNGIWRMMLPTDWKVQGAENLDADGRYLVVSNHQSWVDVLVLQRTFLHRIPFLKFFVKQVLVWVPILGWAWWAMDFPFMKRHSKRYLAKHPEKKGEDLRTTRQMCERFRGIPVSVMSFIEGTRYSLEKSERQGRPYDHLLAPKAGGLAFVVNAMGGDLEALLDVTVVYPGERRRIWDFFCGRFPKVIVDVRRCAIPERLVDGDYEGDTEFREYAQQWVRQLWLDKDRRMTEMLAQYDKDLQLAA